MKAFTDNDAWPVHPRLLVLGPPGTGKTTRVLESFVLPALNGGVAPEGILCCSYSRAAAGEIRARVGKAVTGLPYQTVKRMCSTIHAEAFRLVSAGGGLKLWDGLKQRSLDDADDAPDATEQGVNLAGTVREVAIAAWDYARATMREDDLYEVAVEFSNRFRKIGASVQEIQDEIEAYEAEKEENGAMDFTDLLKQAMRSPPRRLELLILDEAQDCSALQWALFDRWAREAGNVVIVGDEDQAIHKWMGAVPELFRAKIDEGYEARVLSQSYRVPAAVHSFARSIITRNEDRLDAEYLPAASAGNVITTSSPDKIAALCEKAARERIRLFILCRTASIIMGYGERLSYEGIPFINERGGSPYRARKCLDALCAIINLRTSGGTNYGGALALANELAVKGQENLWTGKKKAVMDAVKEGDEDTPVSIDRLAALGLDMRPTLSWPLEHVMGILETVRRQREPHLRIRTYMKSYDRFGIDAFAEEPTIIITTMHASKGREADIVIVSGCCPFPVLREYDDGNVAAIESERRVLYVAATRAKEALVVDLDYRDVYSELQGVA